MCSPHNAAQVFMLSSRAAGISHGVAVREDALDGAPVEVQQQFIVEPV